MTDPTGGYAQDYKFTRCYEFEMQGKGGCCLSLFVLSDTHLSFSLNKPMDVFGRRWDHYTEKLAVAWTACVGTEDTVVIPGDISWAMTLYEAEQDLRYLDALPGRKLIGRGNHDYWWTTVRKMKTFLEQKGMQTIDFLYNNAFRIGDITVCGSRGWWNDPKTSPAGTDYEKIINRETLRLGLSLDAAAALGGTPVVFLHFPPVFREIVCREIVDMLHRYGVTLCYYGHLHMTYDMPPSFEFEGIRFVITSSDYLNFTPLAVEDPEKIRELC